MTQHNTSHSKCPNETRCTVGLSVCRCVAPQMPLSEATPVTSASRRLQWARVPSSPAAPSRWCQHAKSPHVWQCSTAPVVCTKFRDLLHTEAPFKKSGCGKRNVTGRRWRRSRACGMQCWDGMVAWWGLHWAQWSRGPIFLRVLQWVVLVWLFCGSLTLVFYDLMLQSPTSSFPLAIEILVVLGSSLAFSGLSVRTSEPLHKEPLLLSTGLLSCRPSLQADGLSVLGLGLVKVDVHVGRELSQTPAAFGRVVRDEFVALLAK